MCKRLQVGGREIKGGGMRQSKNRVFFVESSLIGAKIDKLASMMKTLLISSSSLSHFNLESIRIKDDL